MASRLRPEIPKKIDRAALGGISCKEIMLKKHAIIKQILDVGVVAVVRTDSPPNAEKIVRACSDGGLSSVELTFTVDGASRIIEALHRALPHCLLGAGTVLDAESARIAILSGASYIVAPIFDRATALLCNRYAIPYMAGCYTPTEALQALEYGVEIIKLFPAAFLSPAAIKVLKAPLPQANFMPTGGITLKNAAEWISAGAVALGVGGDLVAGEKSGNFYEITNKATAYVEAVATARMKQKAKP